MKKLGKRGIVILVLAAVLLVSGGMVVRRLVEYRLGDQEYEDAQELVQLPDLDALPQPDQSQEEPQEEQTVYVDPYADALAAMDFSALREVNSDVLGWILIPGTNLRVGQVGFSFRGPTCPTRCFRGMTTSTT